MPCLLRQSDCALRPLPGLLHATGVCQRKSLAVRDRVLGARLSLSRGDFPLHACAVTFQKRKIESETRQKRIVKFALRGLVKHVFKVCEAVKVNQIVAKEVISRVSIWDKCNSLTTLFHSLFVSAEHRINETCEESVSAPITGINLRPLLTGLLSFLLISGSSSVIVGSDEKFLFVACSIA